MAGHGVAGRRVANKDRKPVAAKRQGPMSIAQLFEPSGELEVLALFEIKIGIDRSFASLASPSRTNYDSHRPAVPTRINRAINE